MKILERIGYWIDILYIEHPMLLGFVLFQLVFWFSFLIF